jgi:hypothetical protein
MFRALILLAAAVAVPYVVTHTPSLDGIWQAGKNSFTGSTAVDEGLTPRPNDVALSPQGPGAILYPNSSPLEGLPSISLHEVFRFDVSKEWVYQRWARKSMALAELGLHGIRVPLVTGTQLHDLAGSLTYYFSESGRLERISFYGRTGDTTQLVMLVAQRYGLQQQSTVVVGEQLWQIRRGEQVFSELRSRPAPVLWANSPHNSFTVELELQLPNATTPLPQRTPLVVSPAPEQQPAAVPAAGEDASGETAAKKTPEEAWKSYSPRSRVPKGQVENLDRRERFW